MTTRRSGCKGSRGATGGGVSWCGATVASSRSGRRLLGTVGPSTRSGSRTRRRASRSCRPHQRRVRTGGLPGVAPRRRGGGQVHQHLHGRDRRPSDQARDCASPTPVRRPPALREPDRSTSSRRSSWAAPTRLARRVPRLEARRTSPTSAASRSRRSRAAPNAAILLGIRRRQRRRRRLRGAEAAGLEGRRDLHRRPAGQSRASNVIAPTMKRPGCRSQAGPDPADRVRPRRPSRRPRSRRTPTSSTSTRRTVPGRPQEPQAGRQHGEAARHRPVHRHRLNIAAASAAPRACTSRRR